MKENLILLGEFTLFFTSLFVPAVVSGLWNFPVGLALFVIYTILLFLVFDESLPKTGLVTTSLLLTIAAPIVVHSFLMQNTKPDSVELVKTTPLKVERFLDTDAVIVADGQVLNLGKEKYWEFKSKSCDVISIIETKTFRQIQSINSRIARGHETKYSCVLSEDINSTK